MNDSGTVSFPEGVITAILTPMDRALNADFKLLANHGLDLLEKGSDGLVLLGTTGEANSFSVREREVILSHIAKSKIPAKKVMVGAGCCAIPDTIELTKHALEHGIHHVLMLPPFYYKQVTDEGLYAFYAKVVEGIADPRLRVYLYQIPQNTGIRFSHELIAKLIRAFPEVIAGMKDSSGDWEYTQSVIRAFPGFRVYSGSEDFLLHNLQAGGPGAISATANVTTVYAKHVMDAFSAGRDATQLQEQLTQLRRVFSGQPLTGALKGFLGGITGNRQWMHIRPPNTLPDDDAILRLIDQYKGITGHL